jgi:hypothetical protein
VALPPLFIFKIRGIATKIAILRPGRAPRWPLNYTTLPRKSQEQNNKKYAQKINLPKLNICTKLSLTFVVIGCIIIYEDKERRKKRKDLIIC